MFEHCRAEATSDIAQCGIDSYVVARHRREVKHDGRILRIYASKITARQKRRELVLKIAPIGGLKFGARREMSYLCRCI